MKKYQKGDKIESLDDVMNQKFIYYENKVCNIGWFQNWQIVRVKMDMELGKIFYADIIHKYKDEEIIEVYDPFKKKTYFIIDDKEGDVIETGSYEIATGIIDWWETWESIKK